MARKDNYGAASSRASAPVPMMMNTAFQWSYINLSVRFLCLLICLRFQNAHIQMMNIMDLGIASGAQAWVLCNDRDMATSNEATVQPSASTKFMSSIDTDNLHPAVAPLLPRGKF